MPPEPGQLPPLAYKGTDVDGLVRTCRDLSDLKRKLNDMDAY